MLLKVDSVDSKEIIYRWNDLEKTMFSLENDIYQEEDVDNISYKKFIQKSLVINLALSNDGVFVI